MTRRQLATTLLGATASTAFLTLAAARAASPIKAKLYKNPECSCCESYARYLDDNGFQVEVVPTNDLAEISRNAGIPENLEGCHTMFVGGYVVDGHVPVQTVRKLLNEKPDIAGITLPGMPSGSPGMFGEKAGPLTIYAVNKDGTPPRVFAVD